MTELSIPEWLNQARTAGWDDRTLSLKAVELAQQILAQAQKNSTFGEKRQAAQLARMMHDAKGKAFTLALADRLFRPSDIKQGIEQLRYLLEGYGMPQYFSPVNRLAMKAGIFASSYAPALVLKGIEYGLRAESAKVILPAERNKLRAHVRKRRKEGIRLNFNQLGEAILGEEEAAHRMQQILDLLAEPECDYISVKISAICSQINLIAFEETLAHVQERLRTLFRAAKQHAAQQPDGTKKPKFINLDMEEYRDLHLTCEAFKRTLMEEEFLTLRAGIVLQAYLPDSWDEQKKLCEWAKTRVEKGGSTIKLRLVKGANLAMEQVDASLHGWPQAPYTTKDDTDANYKRMLRHACMPENAKYIDLGLATHNLFDFGYALLLAEREGASGHIEFEMLEGMANPHVRAIAKSGIKVLLYAPVVYRKDFPHAIAYLVRRLDENSGEHNFLHDIFDMSSSSPAWGDQKKRFLAACKNAKKTKHGPNRTQNREEETIRSAAPGEPFDNEPDTDWSLPANTAWVRRHLSEEKERTIEHIPLSIGSDNITGNIVGIGRDPSQPDKEAYQFSYIAYEHIPLLLAAAREAAKSWGKKSVKERAAILHKTAAELSRMRGRLIASMVRDTAKSPAEADVEVSEAIDFCRYYADGLTRPGMEDGSAFTPLGALCVSSPWNFPCAIPCGGIAAALMAGNAVIFKPSPASVYIAHLVRKAFVQAGVPEAALQFAPTLPNEIGQKLLSAPELDGIILTGSYATASLFRQWSPERPVFGETSGKDSIIITALADREQAIRDLVKSAFGHSGQKCSAASLAIVEASVYDDPRFMAQLRDAAASLKVGPAWEAGSVIVPLTRRPGAELLRALTKLDTGESWLLEPKRQGDNERHWSPGIRLGVKPGSWFHRTECFGPVLGIVRAENLDEAISIQNGTTYGLTGGICTLDEREIALWKNKVQVGNAYINRPITGAIVRRQPFGGWKQSCVGPGAKAGGPNYLTMFGTWKETALPKERNVARKDVAALASKLGKALPEAKSRLEAAAGSLEKWWNEEFGVSHDPSNCHGETNIFRYIPASRTVLRIEESMEDADIAIALLASVQAGTPITLSMAKERKWLKAANLPEGATITVETRQNYRKHFAEWAEQDAIVRDPSADACTHGDAHLCNLRLLKRPILANARIELLGYCKEQTVTETTHRYGNIVMRPAAP